MRNTAGLVAAAAAAVVALGAGPASAAPGDAEQQATLRCGAHAYQITGFGRGQVFHVVGGGVFVVTQAQIVSAEGTRTVFDNPGKAGGDGLVTCTTASPGGTSYAFRGFFTPAA